MAKTDNPLKQLITTFITDFAIWLLGPDVRQVVSRAGELPTDLDPIRSDQVFEVTRDDGRTAMLHLEFQGRRSHKPMHLRLLDYMTRMTTVYRDVELYNIVIYVGRGAGRDDTGVHETRRADGGIALFWSYQVIHLWQMDAEELVALGRPAWLALVGQTRMQQPETVLPQVLAAFKTVTDAELQHKLLTTFLALIDDKEILTMVKQLIADDEDELLLDTPFLQELRAEREEGREEGVITTLRRNILDAVLIRFHPPEAVAEAVTATLATLTDEAVLHTLFVAAIQVGDMAAFQAVLATHTQPADN